MAIDIIAALRTTTQKIKEYADALIDALPISVDDSGYTDFEGVRRTTKLDFSNFDNGKFYEMIEGNSTQFAYDVTFDELGRPVRIKDLSSNKECDIVW